MADRKHLQLIVLSVALVFVASVSAHAGPTTQTPSSLSTNNNIDVPIYESGALQSTDAAIAINTMGKAYGLQIPGGTLAVGGTAPSGSAVHINGSVSATQYCNSGTCKTVAQMLAAPLVDQISLGVGTVIFVDGANCPTTGGTWTSYTSMDGRLPRGAVPGSGNAWEVVGYQGGTETHNHTITTWNPYQLYGLGNPNTYIPFVTNGAYAVVSTESNMPTFKYLTVCVKTAN